MLGLAEVEAARERVAETVRHTPLEGSYTFSEMTGADVHLKLETFQRTGAFKIRGATNRIATLPEEDREAGVVTASAATTPRGSRWRPRGWASTRRSSCPRTPRSRR